jgi:hypothetical protein
VCVCVCVCVRVRVRVRGNRIDRTGHSDRASAIVESAVCAGAMLSESIYLVASSRAQIAAAAVSPSGGQA